MARMERARVQGEAGCAGNSRQAEVRHTGPGAAARKNVARTARKHPHRHAKEPYAGRKTCGECVGFERGAASTVFSCPG
jgi:hypothetical protein